MGIWISIPSRNGKASNLPNIDGATMWKMIRELEKVRILSKELSVLLMDFHAIRNAIYHSSTRIAETNLRKAIEAGEVVLSELERLSPGRA